MRGIKRQSSKPNKALIRKADDAFQTMIRYRDNFTCISCGRKFNFGERTYLHAGHYISRKNYSTRWDEMNVHAQCARCNMLQSYGDAGVFLNYTNALRAKCGWNAPEILVAKSHTPFKVTREFLEDIIKTSKEFINNKKEETNEQA